MQCRQHIGQQQSGLRPEELAAHLGGQVVGPLCNVQTERAELAALKDDQQRLLEVGDCRSLIAGAEGRGDGVHGAKAVQRLA